MCCRQWKESAVSSPNNNNKSNNQTVYADCGSKEILQHKNGVGWTRILENSSPNNNNNNNNNKSNNQTVYADADDKKSLNNTKMSLLLLFRFVVYQIWQPWTHPPQIRECREIENLGKIPGFWSSPILHLHLIKCFN